MKTAFVGLGAMGGRMAGALLRAGHDVTGFDLSEQALSTLEAAGGKRAASVAEAAAGAEALVLMVVNAAQAETVLFEAGGLDALPEGALVLSAVTMPAEAAEAIEARILATGRLFLDAPVSGGVVGAEKGALTFMASGSEARLQPAASWWTIFMVEPGPARSPIRKTWSAMASRSGEAFSIAASLPE
ncbi:MAG: NAD(P)-binding domain-containing protein, partial [Pseudomonadota bacterium]